MTSPKRRRIAVLSTSRADYSHLRCPLALLRDHPGIELRLIAMGAQLSPEFGSPVVEFAADGFAVDERVECLLSSDTDVGMAKSIGVAALGLAEVLGRMRPDILFLVADRYELLAPASVALALRIPIAHLEGGEVSEGAVDDAVRNAITRMAHLHLTTTETARRRILAVGEEPWRVHRVGAPSLDHLTGLALPSRAEVEARIGVKLRPPTVLVAYHPVTLARDTLREADALFAALEALPHQLIFCFPNADAGGRALIGRARELCQLREDRRLLVNLHPVDYLALLRESSVLVGNSSSGIMETTTLGTPAVDVGMRQQGRERAQNVLHAEAEREAILAAVSTALDPAFRARVANLESPYGDGRASERIVRLLAEVPLGEALLHKRAPPPPPPGADPAPGPGRPPDHARIPLALPEVTDADVAAVVGAMRSRRLSSGPQLEAFERACAEFLSAPEAIAVNSGTSGLHLALAALGVGPGDEVITPSFSFAASATCIVQVGAQPAFAEIDPQTLCLDPRRVEEAITPRTRALLAVHLFGRPAPMEELQAIARRHGLLLIEDACEAFGSAHGGRRVGTFGDAGVFAFYANKPITTGEGGLVVARDPAVSARIRRLRNQGRDPAAGWLDLVEAGCSFRLSDLHCALGLSQLGRIERILERRDAIAHVYERRLLGAPGIVLPAPPQAGSRISRFAYPLRLEDRFTREDRDAVVKALGERGIQCGRYFPPLHLQPLFRARHAADASRLATTERVADRSLALPFFHDITDEMIDEVCGTLAEAVEARASRRNR